MTKQKTAGESQRTIVREGMKQILNPTKNWQRTICIDFDGVIAQYKGWKGPDYYGEPMKGSKEFLQNLKKRGIKIVIFTIRPADKIRKGFRDYNFPLPQKITNVKIPAAVYIDDRAVKFNGSFLSLRKELNNFTVYWNKENLLRHYFDGRV